MHDIVATEKKTKKKLIHVDDEKHIPVETISTDLTDTPVQNF